MGNLKVFWSPGLDTQVFYLSSSIRLESLGFSGGSAGYESSNVTAVAQVRLLAQELPHAADMAKNKKEGRKIERKERKKEKE